MSNSSFEPVVERVAAGAVPEGRAAALVSAGPVQTCPAVTTGRRETVVDGVEFTQVAGRSRQAGAVERRRGRDAGCLVLTG